MKKIGCFLIGALVLLGTFLAFISWLTNQTS